MFSSPPSFMCLNCSICLVHLRNGEMWSCGDKQLQPPSQQELAHLSLAVFTGLTIPNLNLTSPCMTGLECVDKAISTHTVVVDLLHCACWGDKVSCPTPLCVVGYQQLFVARQYLSHLVSFGCDHPLPCTSTLAHALKTAYLRMLGWCHASDCYACVNFTCIKSGVQVSSTTVCPNELGSF